MSETATSTPAATRAPALPARGFLRRNLEAWTVAIVMTLVLKLHVVEAFQVPTESMEPTIIGRTDGGDRIIVNKFVYQIRDPERWEVVVFRYPLSRLVNYVKRAVGMPGETVRIARGDVFSGADPAGPFAIARKPRGVLEAILENHPVIPAPANRSVDPASFREWWQVPLQGAALDREDEVLELDARKEPRVVTFRNPRAITNERRDAMASTRRQRLDAEGSEPMGDLRLLVEAEVLEAGGALTLAITDGSMVERPVRLEIATEGAAAASSLRFGDEDLTNEALRGVRIASGDEVTVSLENVDDRLRVEIDGDEVLVHDYAQPLDAAFVRPSEASFGLSGGRARVARVRLDRDLHYTLYRSNPKDTFVVPPDHYLCLGDNSPNSLDARDWRVVGIRLREDGRILLGDLEAVSDDLFENRQDNNPWIEADDPGVHHYVDVEGNHWRLEPGSYDLIDLAAWERAGGTRVLSLHGTLWPEDHPQVAKRAVDGAVYAGIVQARQNDPSERDKLGLRHLFRALSVNVHFAHRDEIIGQGILVFWPPSRAGVIR